MRILLLCCFVALGAACGHHPLTTSAATPGKTPDKTPDHAPTILNAEVFSGKNNLEVTLLELPDNQALIYFRGVKGEFAGKVMAHTKEFTQHNSYQFLTPFNGQPFTTLEVRNVEGMDQWELITPSLTNRVMVFRDPLKTKHVNTAAILRLHEKQQASGALAALAQVSPKRNQQIIIEELQGTLANLAKECGTQPTLEVNWSSVPDKLLFNRTVTSLIRTVLYGLKAICGAPSGKAFFRGHSHLMITLGANNAIEPRGNTLHWTVSPHMQLQTGAAIQQLKEIPREGPTLGQQMIIDQTEICATPEQKIVILSPRDSSHYGISYGENPKFYHVGGFITGNSGVFRDPRFQFLLRENKYQRFLSSVKTDRKKGTCELRCGEQTKMLRLLPLAEIPPLLARAVYQPSPHQREAYALARNRQGLYYYVDRGITSATKKDFRVYIGRRGRMRQQQMKDIVSDSKGEIFSTKTGDLRLVVSKTQAMWISKSKEQELLWLPVEDNLNMIYNELGPYLGQRLGTPCDDF